MVSSKVSSRFEKVEWPSNREDICYLNRGQLGLLYEAGEDRTRWLRLTIPYAQTPKVTKYGCNVGLTTGWCGGGKAASLADLDTKTRSSYFYDAGTKKLYLKLYSVETDWEELEVQPAP